MADPSIILMIAMFVVVYFFFMRPQQKKAKAQDAFLDELAKGQKVVTTGGIIGKITQVDGSVVTLSLDGKSTCKFTKGAISKEMTDALIAEDE